MSAQDPAREETRAGEPAEARPRRFEFLRNSAAPLAFLLFAGAFLAAWGESRKWAGIDYYQFWVVGRAVAEGDAGNIYSDAERARLGQSYWEAAQLEAGTNHANSMRFNAAQARQKLETYSTPFLYTLIGLASSGDFDRDQARFQHASLVIYVLGLFALARLLGFGPLASVGAVVLFLAWFSALASDIRTGNVNRLQLGVVALALWILSRPSWRGHRALAGFVLGCAAMFKPNLAFLVASLGTGWLLRRRFAKLLEVALGCAVGALAAFGISSAYFGGTRAWSDWAHVLPELMQQYDAPLGKGNFALTRLLRQTSDVPDAPLGYLAVFLVVLAAIFGGRAFLDARAKRPAPAFDPEVEVQWDVLLVGLGAALSLLTTQLAWLHYFVLVVPLSLYALRPRPDPEAGDASGRALFVRRAAAFVAVLLVNFEGVRAFLGIPEGGAPAVRLVCGGTVLLLVLAASDAPRPDPLHVR